MADSKDEESNTTVAVIDSGSGFVKAGFTGEIAPTTIIPTVIGGDDIVGFDALSQLDSKDLIRPMQRGMVSNWDEMEKIWNYTLKNELKVAEASDMPCLVTQSSSASKENREKMLHIFFEGMDIPAFYLSNQQVLSLYASSKTSGLVVDCGFDCCHIVPVFDGSPVQKGTIRWDVGGSHLTNYLQNILGKNEKYSKIINENTKTEIIRSIKEKCCYVASDFESESKENGDKNNKKIRKFELPDGKNLIELNEESIIIPEILFNPSKYLDNKNKANDNGIGQLIKQSFDKCENKIQKEISDKVEIVGGGSMFDGFGKRLQNELNTLCKNENLKVIDSKERKYAAWIGGSIFAGLSTFKDNWISADEWEESGPSVVHRCQTLN